MTTLVMDAVRTWRATWSTRLAEAADEAARRQQHLLDEAIADIRAAAAELLGGRSSCVTCTTAPCIGRSSVCGGRRSPQQFGDQFDEAFGMFIGHEVSRVRDDP